MIGYYWVPPTWATKAGYATGSEALGFDYGAAKDRRDTVLNPQFRAWRPSGADKPDRSVPGTFDWMMGVYRSSLQYRGKPPKTRKSYDFRRGDRVRIQAQEWSAVRLVEPEKHHAGGRGQALRSYQIRQRVRTAILAMTVCRRAWNVARRSKPQVVPLDNPFSKMGLTNKAKPTRPVGYESLMRFVEVCDAAGDFSVGTAAMIAFFWLQRQVDILSRFSWMHDRPAESPDMAILYAKKRSLNAAPAPANASMRERKRTICRNEPLTACRNGCREGVPTH